MYYIIIKINLIYEKNTKEKPDALVNHIFEMQHVQTCPQILVIDMLWQFLDSLTLNGSCGHSGEIQFAYLSKQCNLSKHTYTLTRITYTLHCNITILVSPGNFKHV